MTEERGKPAERGYGNIYTPHAGAMIIHVQRESGLANRTIILTRRQVRLLRIGAIVLATLITVGALSWVFLAAQAARVPLLTRRVAQLQHDVARVDTLQHSLDQLAARFQQVQTMMGTAATPRAGGANQLAASGLAPAAALAAADSTTPPNRWPLPVPGAVLPTDAANPHAVDVAVPIGTPVRAAGPGLVVEVRNDPTLGTLVRISHPAGYETVYAGVSEVRVTKGDHVAAGAIIALSGNASGALEPHLHFEMRRHGVAIDASSIIRGRAHGDLQ
jgi:murein DD-endopeptidase MepM/ murein hydrolase activator NlpD